MPSQSAPSPQSTIKKKPQNHVNFLTNVSAMFDSHKILLCRDSIMINKPLALAA